MMPESQELSNTIQELFSSSSSPVYLFAGAGVSKRAGYCDWDGYIEHLAGIVDNYETEVSVLIRKRLREHKHLQAADYYLSCDVIPEGEKYKGLAVPFERQADKDHTRLVDLVSLPFAAILTTNYDKSLHDAYALHPIHTANNRPPSVTPVELGDGTMRGAPFLRDFFIARIHGRADLPETMVVDSSGYRRVQDDAHYADLLLHAMKDRTCLFVGYSFNDPAINVVLNTIKDRYRPAYPQLHLALVPADCGSDLVSRLAGFNIKLIKYSPDNNHEALWLGIEKAARFYRNRPTVLDKHEHPPHLKTIHRLLASRYVGMLVAKEMQPIQDMAVDTIVCHSLQCCDGNMQRRSHMEQEVGKYIALQPANLSAVVNESILRLEAAGIVETADEFVALKKLKKSDSSDSIGVLVKGVTARSRVLSSRSLDDQDEEDIRNLVLDLLVVRGWDLGAHFAGGKEASDFDAWPEIELCLRQRGKDIVRSQKGEIIARAVYNLLRRPSDEEVVILGQMGRLAFGLALVVESSNYALTHEMLLPQRLYLDANVVMPLVLDGHPYSEAYRSALARLKEAAQSKGLSCEVVALEDFLNEIVHHRQLAQEEIATWNGEDPKILRRQITIAGSANVNVFIAAYSSVLASQKKCSFHSFLAEFAPFEDEASLKGFLTQKGIRVASFEDTPDRTSTGHKVFHALRAMLEQEADEKGRRFPRKADILVRHEARQIMALSEDIAKGTRAFFVTADRHLMRHVEAGRIGGVSGSLISPIGLVQLIDMLVGVRTATPSMARLLMPVETLGIESQIRDYLLSTALEHRDEVMTMKAYEVADKIAKEVSKEAEDEGVDFKSPVADVIRKSHAFMERTESRFFEKLADTVEDFKKKYKLE